MQTPPQLTAFILTGFLLTFGHSHFDLFMNATETKRILGINGSLYYVHNGFINEYALSFNLPIKSSINTIYFNWQNLQSSSTDNLIKYNLAVLISNPSVVLDTSINIPKDGIVPIKPSVFSVALHCSGRAFAEVDVRIQLNITSVALANVTALEIRRRKSCVKGNAHSPNEHHIEAEDGHSRNSASNNSTFNSMYNSKSEMFGANEIFYVVIGGASGIIILLAFGLFIFYCRSQKSSHSEICQNNAGQAFHNHEATYIRTDTPTSNSIISGGTCRGPVTFPYLELKLCDAESSLAEDQVDRSLVTVSEIFLEGSFGRICRGRISKERSNSSVQQSVLIKTLTDQASNGEQEAFIRDCYLTRGTNHENVACIIATVLDFPPLLIYTDLNDENLKRFLQQSRTGNAMSAHRLICVAIQIGLGVHHLHRRHILHRDIATRNCLVNSNLHVRICDSALSHDIFPGDYQRLNNGEMCPVKWMAVESLTDGRYTQATDTWSYGVTIWELFAFGHQPYTDIGPHEMVRYLCDGFRLVQPLNCPSEVFAMISRCWIFSSADRVRLVHLISNLKELYRTTAGFV